MDKLISCNKDLQLALEVIGAQAVYNHPTEGTGIYIKRNTIDSADLEKTAKCQGDLQNPEAIIKQIFGIDVNGNVYINVFETA